jgi:hypothetical protein
MFGESTSPVENVLSNDPLCGNRECTAQGVPAQITGCSSAVCLAVRNEGILMGRRARLPFNCLLRKRNKSNFHSSANAVEGSFVLLGGGDGVTSVRAVKARMGPNREIQQSRRTQYPGRCLQLGPKHPPDGSGGWDEMRGLELGVIATRAESRVKKHLEEEMATVLKNHHRGIGSRDPRIKNPRPEDLAAVCIADKLSQPALHCGQQFQGSIRWPGGARLA